MATSLNKVITRNADNTINTSTNYSELNVKASNLTNNLVTHLEAQITTMEGAMQAKEGAVDVKIASLASVGTSTYTTPYLDRSLSMMSKAEFNAVAAERRANRAGSGFDSFGWCWTDTVGYPRVNEGIMTAGSSYLTGYNNRVILGYTTLGSGTSITPYASVVVNGVSCNLKGLNDGNGAYASILLPPAPTVLPSTATLTQQQIDSGVIKHADASNSGLIVNGKFDTDTSGWSGVATGSTLSWSNGQLTVTNTAYNLDARQSFVSVVGKKYIVEATIVSSNNYTNSYLKAMGSNSDADVLGAVAYTQAGRVYVEFTANSTLTTIRLHQWSNIGVTTWDNISVFPADAISRSDLVFLESWHEDISEKGVVYRYGNVQFKGASESAFGTQVTPSAGTPVFAGYGTYSLFSDTWQADEALIGNCYIWANMTDTQRKAFVADPENNSYLDGDKVIQVRYRIRDVMGWGDSWQSIDTQTKTFFAYDNGTYSRVQAKGKMVSQNDLSSSSTLQYLTPATGTYTLNIPLSSYGIYQGGSVAGSTDIGYDKQCYAIPITLVHRRNQGMMHPVYNPNGTKLASDSLPWHSTTISFTSIADCFTDSKLLATSGYIGTTTGRADGIFYDQVHEGDITDLRMNSRGMNDYQRTSDKWFAKLQDGTYRGTEGEKYTEAKVQTTTGTVATVEVNDGTKYPIGSTIYIYDLTASAVKGRFTVKSISTNTLTVDVAFAKLANNYLISGASSTRTKSNTMTVYDVIGNPANYPADWKTQYASLTSLHTAEDGTSLLPTGTTGSDGLAVFKLSRDANATPLQVLKSTDSGATWTALTVTTHYTFSTTTNAITFTAGNIPLTTDLVRVTYQTHTNMCTATTNAVPIAIGKGIATNGIAHGQMIYSLIGKVATASTAPYAQFGYNSYGYRIDPTTLKFSTTSTEFPLHTAFTLAGGAVGIATVKANPYLTSSNGRAYVNIQVKEMKHNGTSYGDDGKFVVVDNVSTTTDNNSLTVLTATKRIELPYFISASE